MKWQLIAKKRRLRMVDILARRFRFRPTVDALEDRWLPAPLTLTLIAASSSLTLSGTVNSSQLGTGNIVAQGTGSLVTTYSGPISTDYVPGSSITFTSGSAATAANSGNWQPNIGGGSGSAPANYGAKATVGSILTVTVLLAPRMVVLAPTSGALTLTQTGPNTFTFPSSQLFTVTPTGNADYSYSGVASGSGNVSLINQTANNAAGTSTLTTSASSVSVTMPVNLTIVNTFTAGSGTVTITIHLIGTFFATGQVKSDSTTVVSSSANPSVFGQSTTFTATVNGTGGTPTGTVTFNDGSTSIGSGTLSGGKATFSTSGLSVGTHTITAAYGGDGNFNASNSAAITQTVNKGNSSTTVSSSTNPTVFGQSATFTATVSASSPAAGTPGGTVQFFIDGSEFGTPITLSGGSATTSTSGLGAGTHSVSAIYSGDGDFNASTSSAITQTVNKDASSTNVSSTANPTVFGQSTTFTATVTSGGPAAGPPTGTVTFNDGGASIGSGTLSGGSASFSTSGLAVGNHTITVSYGGDGNFTPSTSAAITQTVSKDAMTATVASSPNPSVFGQSVTFSATVTANGPGAGTPTGTVTFDDGGASIGSGTLSGGSASFSASGLAVGNHTITVSYGGDGNFTGSTSAAITQTVNKDGTTASVASLANPSVFGQDVTFSATVTANSPGAGTPTGTVTFNDGGASIGSGTLSGGSATLSTSGLAVGTHTITVFYSGDGNFNGSNSSNILQTVAKDNTSASVTSSANPSVFGQMVTFTATVTANLPGAGTPTGGTVLFNDGAVFLGSATLSGGTASFSTSALAVTTNHPINVIYQGDGNFSASGSNSIMQTVNQAGTSTAVTSSTNPTVFGQSTTFTATVSASSPGSGTPTGTVEFDDSGVSIGSGTLSGGSATFSTSSLSVGNHTITASYSGDFNFSASTSAAITQTVNQGDTSSGLTTSVNPTVTGQATTFTLTVSAVSPAAGTPTGMFTVFVNGSSLGTGTLMNGMATLTTGLPAGQFTISVVYDGDANFNPSTSNTIVQTVNPGDTTTTLMSSLNPSNVGESVTFTATVSAVSPAAGTASGTVEFDDSGVSIGSGTLSGGSATFSTSSLSAGNHAITVSWSRYRY
jgi:hypothetical protein